MNDQQVRALLKEVFHQVAPDITFEEIKTSQPLRSQAEIDSYDFYRIILQIDERAGVKIPDSMVLQMKNLDQLISFVVKNSSQSLQINDL